MFTLAFLKGAGERALKTFAQTLLGYFVVGTTGLIGFDWAGALSVAGAAALASVLTSIANPEFVSGAPVIEDGPGAHAARGHIDLHKK